LTGKNGRNFDGQVFFIRTSMSGSIKKKGGRRRTRRRH